MPLDQVVAASDFLTIHLPKNKETTGLIGRELLLKAKPSLRLINVARGGIVVESELAECIRDGVIAGAALDVFEKEPTTESPLFELDQVVVTPHLGASTREAQDKAGDAIADMVEDLCRRTGLLRQRNERAGGPIRSGDADDVGVRIGDSGPGVGGDVVAGQRVAVAPDDRIARPERGSADAPVGELTPAVGDRVVGDGQGATAQNCLGAGPDHGSSWVV